MFRLPFYTSQPVLRQIDFSPFVSFLQTKSSCGHGDQRKRNEVEQEKTKKEQNLALLRQLVINKIRNVISKTNVELW